MLNEEAMELGSFGLDFLQARFGNGLVGMQESLIFPASHDLDIHPVSFEHPTDAFDGGDDPDRADLTHLVDVELIVDGCQPVAGREGGGAGVGNGVGGHLFAGLENLRNSIYAIRIAAGRAEDMDDLADLAVLIHLGQLDGRSGDGRIRCDAEEAVQPAVLSHQRTIDIENADVAVDHDQAVIVLLFVIVLFLSGSRAHLRIDLGTLAGRIARLTRQNSWRI